MQIASVEHIFERIGDTSGLYRAREGGWGGGMPAPGGRPAIGGLMTNFESLVGPRGVGGIGDPSHLLGSKGCSPAYQTSHDQSLFKPAERRECQVGESQSWGSQGRCEMKSAVRSKLSAPKLGARQRADGRSLSRQGAVPIPVRYAPHGPQVAEAPGGPQVLARMGERTVGHKPDTLAEGSGMEGEEPSRRVGRTVGSRLGWSTILAQVGAPHNFSIPGMEPKGTGPRVIWGKIKGR